MAVPRFHVEINRALAMSVAIAALVLGLVDLVLALAGVEAMSIPRVAFATASAAWAYREWRRPDPDLLPVLLVGAVVTAVGSIAQQVVTLPFEWYDEYTSYGILVGVGVLSAALCRRPRWLGTSSWVGPSLWALASGLLADRPIDDVIDWTIVAGATVALLHYVVRRLLDAATASAATEADLASLHRGLARCSNILLNDSSDSALEDALTALLEATEADYVCVDSTVYGAEVPAFEIVAEASHGPIPETAEWESGSYGDLPTILAAHLAGEVCEVRVDELTGRERQLYERDGIRTELSVPILVDGIWEGSLSFAEFDRSRRWSPLEVEAIVQAAGMVSAYWRRRADQRRLEDLVRSKDELIASVSHELRTPLTAVVGLTEEMASPSSGFDAVTMGELAGVVADQSRELADLVEDLLVAARVETGGLTMTPTSVCLLEQTARVAESTAGVDVVPSGDMGATVWADPLRCRQVIRNLLTNAVRYGGGNVDVTVSAGPDSVVLTVSDDGDGVPDSDVERIFEPYVRSRVVAPGSVGIGLSVSRNLAALMGGTLEYGRRNGRTEFSLTLPRASQGEAVTPSLPVAEVVPA